MLSFFKRTFFLVVAAGVSAVVFRVRGRGGTPPRREGWREVSESELSSP